MECCNEIHDTIMYNFKCFCHCITFVGSPGRWPLVEMSPALLQGCTLAKPGAAGEHPTAAVHRPPYNIEDTHLQLQKTSPGDQQLCPMFGSEPGKAGNTLSPLGVSDGLGRASCTGVPKLESACETSSCQNSVLPSAPL